MVGTPGYRPVWVLLKNRESITGVLRKETPEAYVVKLSDESLWTVLKAEVERIEIDESSNMPSYNDIMTIEQLADLLAYLKTLR